MKCSKRVKTFLIIGISGFVIVVVAGLYMFNMPHRDVQSAKTDYTLTVSGIVAEYLSGPDAANMKYLADDGDSKILEITGEVSKISENYNGQKVVLLKSDIDKAGVSATFTKQSNSSLYGLKIGQTISIKGVIRSGAAFDEDLELYENVIIEKSKIVNK